MASSEITYARLTELRIVGLGLHPLVFSTMKTIPSLLLGMVMPVFAGTSAIETAAPAPASEPCLLTWFTGASVGYLTELEEPMYNLHLGTDTCWQLGGWNVALFLEVGYAEKDDSWSGTPPPPPSNVGSTIPRIIESIEAVDSGEDDDLNGNLDDLEDLLSGIADLTPNDTSYDLDIIPITFNVKLERPLTGNLNAYVGGGLGAALVDLSVDAGPVDFSDDDWVFTGQLFAGLNYNFNESFEMYGGARWIYYDDAGLGGSTLELDDDFLFEIGARFNF